MALKILPGGKLILFATLLSLSLLLTFQNCSQQGFEALESSTVKSDSFSSACGDGMATDANGTCVSVENACNFNGLVVANNSEITAFKQLSVVSPAVCESQSRSCKNGILSGSFGHTECSVKVGQASTSDPMYPDVNPDMNPDANPDPMTPVETSVPDVNPVVVKQSCSFGGSTLSDGGTSTGFDVAQVNYGESCSKHSYSVKCENGTLNPSYLFSKCVESAAKPNIVGMGGYVVYDAYNNPIFHDHGCYIVKGALKCAGSNRSGQLGNGTLVGSGGTLTSVPDFSSGVTSVAGGFAHSCAIKNGAVYCWGLNSSGELGKGVIDSNKYSGPQATLNLTSEVSQIAIGYNHSCAIKSGALYCWGNNANGKLGDSSVNNNSTPKIVNGMTSDVTDVALGIQHTCAIRSGTMYCWGLNTHYQIGDGTTTPQKVPKGLPLIKVTMIAASSFGTCAISDGKLYCWGYNANLQAGQGGSSTADIRSPSQVGVSNLVNVRKVLSNYAAHHVCAIDETSNNNYNLKCWGNNNRYQLGLGNTGNLSTPTIITVGSSGNDIADVSMNLDATCATKTNGDLYCWGTNYSGFMGIGAPTTYPRFTTPRLLFNLL